MILSAQTHRSLAPVWLGLAAAGILSFGASAGEKGERAKEAEVAEATPADAKPAPAVAKSETLNFQSWTVSCNTYAAPSNVRKCLARLNVVKGVTKQRIVVVALGANVKGEMRLDVQIPTSTSIPEGVTVKLDDNPALKAPIVLCDPTSCLASAPLDAKLGAALRESGKASVSWASLAAGPIAVNFGVNGAREALAALVK